MTDEEEEYAPLPPKPELVRAVGRAVGKTPGIQTYPDSWGRIQPEIPVPPGARPVPLERSERGRKAWETRRANAAAHELPDRHFTGKHPYDVAIEALTGQLTKIKEVIHTLEELKKGRL